MDITVKFIGNKMHIENYPKAARFVRYDFKHREILRSLYVHEKDLEQSLMLAKGIKIDPSNGSDNSDSFARFYTSLGLLISCFKRAKGRRKLISAEIFDGQAEAKKVFEFFEALRDKHIIHDENNFSSCVIGVVLNHPGSENFVEDIVTFQLKLDMRTEGNIQNLQNLIAFVLEKVKLKRKSIWKQAMEELKELPESSWKDIPNVTWKVPSVEEVNKTKADI